MTTRLRERLSICSVFAILLWIATGAVRAQDTSDPPIQVGPNIQVSKAHENDAHYETLLAADPRNANNLLGTSMAFSEEKNKWLLLTYSSADGGKTWAPTLTIDQPETCCDPTVVFGADRMAYFSYFGPSPYGKYFSNVYRSTDSGKTWSFLTRLPLMDRNYLAFDKTGGKYDGRLYLFGENVTRDSAGNSSSAALIFYISKDNGLTFQPPAQIVAEHNHHILGFSPSVITADGNIVIVFGDVPGLDLRGTPEERPTKPNARIQVITSSDGGESFSKATTIADYALPWTPATSFMPSLAADRSTGTFKNRLYVVYPSVVLGTVQIMFSYSSDKGQTWSTPVQVKSNQIKATTTNDDFMPVVAVNNSGVIGVTWYDRDESTNRLDWRPRFTASVDGGETFLPAVWVSEAAFKYGQNEKLIVRANSRNTSPASKDSVALNLDFPWLHLRGGDTTGLAADAKGIFHAFWVDNRTGIPQIWTSAIEVNRAVYRNGAPELAKLDDISDRVAIEYSEIQTDRASNVVSLSAQLRNISSQPITSPIKLRVINLGSEVSDSVKIIGSNNDRDGIGAIWDFSDLLRGGRLEPGETTMKKTVRLRFPSLKPFKNESNRLAFVSLRLRVLGTTNHQAN